MSSLIIADRAIRISAPRPVGTTMTRIARKTAGYGFASTLAHHRTPK
jgi:hypothetical protein